MLITAGVLATLAGVSLIMLFKKLPPRVRKFLIDHPFLFRLCAFSLCLGTLGATLTGVVAGAMLDCFVNVGLYIAEHPNDFSFINDWMDMFRAKMNELKEWIVKYNEEWKKNKEVGCA
jgi:hypothetical protein